MEKLFENLDVSIEEKVALTEAFENAVLKKATTLLDEAVEAQVNEKVELLEVEYKEKEEQMVESLDGYLDQVVEEFVAENAPSYEQQIDEEKTKTLLGLFDNMISIVGVDMLTIQESKTQRDDEEFNESAEVQVEKLEEKISDMADKLVEKSREADKYLKTCIIAEMSEGLSILEKDKFERLADTVSFDKNPTYISKLDTIKEAIIDNRAPDYDGIPATLPTAAFKHDETVDSKAALDYSPYV